MTDLNWIRAKLCTYEVKKKDNQLTTKQFMDKKAFRENMILGIETMDSEGFIFTEWTGLFFDLTNRKMTDEEFLDYNDWIDNTKKNTYDSIYNELKVWFDKRNIKMIPLVKEYSKVSNQEIEMHINKILDRIYKKRLALHDL